MSDTPTPAEPSPGPAASPQGAPPPSAPPPVGAPPPSVPPPTGAPPPAGAPGVPAAPTTAAAQPTVRRHPLRGAVWGVVLGLGAALLLIGRQVIALGTVLPLGVVLGCLVLGALWGAFAPARGRAPA